MGWGAGVQNHIIFENWPVPLTVWVVFACSGQVSDTLHCTPTPITGCPFGRSPPPPLFLGWKLKTHVSEKVGTVGELYKGKIMKKNGVGHHC